MDLLSSTSISALAMAKTPEEAAQDFLEGVSKGLAAVIADRLGDALKTAKEQTVSATSIAGWGDMVGGCAINLCWERPKTATRIGQVVATAAIPNADMSAKGISVGGSITITGTF